MKQFPIIAVAIALVLVGAFIYFRGEIFPREVGAPLTISELKYKVLEKFGGVFSETKSKEKGIFYCDPDYYPIAFRDERELAVERFPEIEKNKEEFAAILNHLNLAGVTEFSPEQKLLIYREHKHLNAISLEPVEDGYAFHLTVVDEKSMGIGEGMRIDGIVAQDGFIKILKEEKGFYTTCPICLSGNTRIDTPSGEVLVKNLRVGMTVWTVDKDGARVAVPIEKISKAPVPAGHLMAHLILDDGRELFASPGHPTADGRLIGALKVGDTIDGARVSVAERVPYGEGFTPLEAENPAACRGDKCIKNLARMGFNAPRELLTGFTYDILPASETGFYWANGILVGSTLK